MKKVVSLLVVMMLVAQAGAKSRIWSDKKGNTTEAEFVKIMGSKVILKKANGKTIPVPISGLSAADQKYLASLIPPKLKIEVDVDKDRKTLDSYASDYGYGWERKAESASCKVVIKKTNQEACDRAFTAKVFLLGQNIDSSEYKLLDISEHSFNFKRSKQTSFGSDTVRVEYSDSSYGGKDGWRFKGYCVVVRDDKGEIIATEANTSSFVTHVSRLSKAKEGALLNKDMKTFK